MQRTPWWRHAGLGTLLLLTLSGFGCRGEGSLPVFDGERAFLDLETQVGFGPRVPGTPAHGECLAFLVQSLGEAGGRVSIQSFADPGFPLEDVDSLFNVRARFGPDTGPHLVLGAHWDSRPWADQDPDTALHRTPVPGANDGASGVAVLLEVARALGRMPPPLGVEIVFFDGEDAGDPRDPETFCRGSQGYVARLTHPWPVHAVVVDMVGRRGMEIYKERNSRLAAKNLVDRIWDGASRMEATAFHDAERHSVYDDHIAFIEHGIAAVDLIDLDDPAWHTTDDVAANCDPAMLAQVGRTLLWHVYTLEVEPLP